MCTASNASSRADWSECAVAASMRIDVASPSSSLRRSSTGSFSDQPACFTAWLAASSAVDDEPIVIARVVAATASAAGRYALLCTGPSVRRVTVA